MALRNEITFYSSESDIREKETLKFEKKKDDTDFDELYFKGTIASVPNATCIYSLFTDRNTDIYGVRAQIKSRINNQSIDGMIYVFERDADTIGRSIPNENWRFEIYKQMFDGLVRKYGAPISSFDNLKVFTKNLSDDDCLFRFWSMQLIKYFRFNSEEDRIEDYRYHELKEDHIFNHTTWIIKLDDGTSEMIFLRAYQRQKSFYTTSYAVDIGYFLTDDAELKKQREWWQWSKAQQIKKKNNAVDNDL